jgi:hypothetical protein
LELATAARNLKQPPRKEVAGTASADSDRVYANDLNHQPTTRPEPLRRHAGETISEPFEETKVSQVFSGEHLLRLLVLCLLGWLLLGLERARNRRLPDPGGFD